MTKWRIPSKYIFGQCEVKKSRRSYRLLKQLNKYDKYTFDLIAIYNNWCLTTNSSLKIPVVS